MGTLNAFAILHITSKDGLTSPASIRCTWLLEILARAASSRIDILFSIRIRSTYSFSICTHLPLVFLVPCCCLFEKILPFLLCPHVGTFIDEFRQIIDYKISRSFMRDKREILMLVFIAVILIFFIPVVLFFLHTICDRHSRAEKVIHYISISYAVIILVGLFSCTIFFSVKEKATADKEQKDTEKREQFSSAYALGYDDALHGVCPDIENIKCYSCGSTFSDEIHIQAINGLYVPVCESCMDTHDVTNPLYILGKPYFFAPATASTTD